MIDFLSEPISDDYNEDDKFYRILFRPSFAVQARELTQLQTILQNQIKRHGDHIFKQGAMVIPGQISIDTNFNYVKLQASYNNITTETFIANLVGKTLIGASGVEAQVVKVVSVSGSDASTIYVKYTKSGSDNETKTFANNEILVTSDSAYTVRALSSSAIGVGSAAIIQRGVYYINGFFVLCDSQTIILDKYTNTPTYRVGLLINESTITPEDAGYERLLDNAQSSYNYAAPGAYRYFIDLTLTALSVSSTADTDFIELSRVVNGQVQREVRSTDYSVLEETLARRTYDESGNYTVRPFEIDVREHRNNNRGQWLASTDYLLGDVVTNSGITYVAKNSGVSVSIAPTHTSGTAYDGSSSTGIQWEYSLSPSYNRGIYLPENGGDESKLAVGLEPGKAYVRGYEIEKISTEYVVIDKSRDYIQAENSVIPATVGNYVLVTNLNGLPKFDTFELVDLYDRVTGSSGRGTAVGTKIGTCRVRGIDWNNGVIGDVTASYKLLIFGVSLNAGYDFNRDVKSFYYSVTGFSADINPIYTPLIGSVSQSTTSVTGVGTSFVTDLTVGDYVLIDETLSRVASITDQQTMTVDVSATHTGVTLKLVSTIISEPSNSSLIFPLPYYAIKSVRSVNNTNDTNYTISALFSGTSNSSGSLTVSTSAGTFASAALTENYLAIDSSTGDVVLPDSITPSGSSVTFEFGSGLGSTAFSIMGTVNKSGASGTEKTKTLNSATVTFTTLATATSNVLLLGKSDCFKITSILMKSGTFSSPGSTYDIDISDRYTFDNGQRDSFYDYGRLTLKSSFSAPTAPIQIIFEYFTHSNGDYFTVNSYPNTVAYGDIPTFGSVSLRDVFDFRPRINDAGNNFTGTGASITLLPKRGIDVITDFTYYLSRKDKIAIDFNGNFFNIEGVSSLNPGEPQEPQLGMVLYKLTLEPYTFGTNSSNVFIERIDNKNYTMRDIGKLEKRISNLEYYTILSLLEQDTVSLSITDTDGLNRFKNGFIVDNFSGHNVGDVSSPDYMCAIDMESGELKPFFSMQNVNLLENNSNDSQRNADNYKLYGDVITLPLDSTTPHIPLIKQEYASRVELVNPYAIFTFIGDIKLTPSSDNWFEVNRRPDIVQNVEGNFNTVSVLAEATGVLGTVWNSWQTQWTGATTSTGNIFTRISSGSVDTIESFATQVGQSRTGIRNNLVARIDTKVVDDRVLSTAVIPYIRSRNILIQTKGLKPSSKFYPFFDEVDISTYCTPASKITYTIVSGTFDSATNVGGNSSEVARRINGDSEVCLNKGDVITGGTSGATAIVVGSEYNVDEDTHAIFIQNVIGTFTNSETITGSISSAQGTISSIVISTVGDDLISNINGELNLIFDIPNTESVRFRTGSRELKLVDVSEASGQFSSRARANYNAQGILETKQANVIATRNAEIVEERVLDNRVIAQSSERIISSSFQWLDPLAQTFLVQQTGGAFLTKVDLFFAAKDTNIPVTIEIREVVNGYPGKLVLPFSRVTLNPNQINLSSTNVTVDEVSYPTFDTATTFNFPSPVYVQDNNEYCLVIMSDSTKYKVWISQMGDQIPNSTRTISEQPYAGVLFKSQNASTWTANQLQDLKFTIYRAKFNTSVVGAVEFVNDVIPADYLENNPIETKTGTNVIRVWHANHGMSVDSKVILSNTNSAVINGISGAGTITASTASTTVTGSGSSFISSIGSGTVGAGTALYNASGVLVGIVASVASNTSLTLTANAAITISSGVAYKFALPVNGVPVTEIYSTQTITNIGVDWYTFESTTNATNSGYSGGSTIRATHNIAFDVIQPQIQLQTFSDTITNFLVKTTSAKSIDGNQSPYVVDAAFNGVLANENNYFNAPRLIGSAINESTFLSGNKSFKFVVNMSSTNDALSPIIDTHRTSVITISNKLNNPTETNTNIVELDVNTIFTGSTGAYSFAGSTITSTNSSVRALMKSILVGSYIVISGATTTANNGTYLVTGNIDNGTNGIISVSSKTFASESAVSGTAIANKVLFFDEITPAGSTSVSKYVSKNIKLNNPSTFIRVRLSANIPSEASIEVYYKISPTGSTNNLNQSNWVLLSADSNLPKVEIGNPKFTDIDYSKDNLIPFDIISVKIVMKSSNSSASPSIKDLRIIACA